MEIRILSAGKEIGPYSEAQVRQYLSEGLVSASDLAICEGFAEGQPLEKLLARLPALATASENARAEEAIRSVTIRATAPLRTKRGPIVIQPIFSATGGDAPKRGRTGKTSLTIEAPRPTTQLPPVAKFMARDETRNPQGGVGSSPSAPTRLSDRHTTVPGSQVPATTPDPVEDFSAGDETQLSPVPDVPQRASKTDESESLPNLIIYSSALLGLLLLGVAFAIGYLVWHFSTPAPRGTESAIPSTATSTTDPSEPPANPTTSADYTVRGFARQSKGDLDGALSDYDEAVTLDPSNPKAFYRRAVARQTKGDWNGALADYNALLAIKPDDADAYSNRGFVKQSQGDLDGALADYTEALARDPKIAVAYYNVGLIKIRRGDIDGGIEAYNQALDINPNLTRAYYNRGKAKASEGDPNGAIADYTQALVLDPGIATAYLERGVARQTKGDSTGALGDYSQAIEHDSNMAPAYHNRGYLELLRGDLNNAVSDSTHALTLDPSDAKAFFNRGMAELGQADFANAESDLRKYCEVDPHDTDCDSARLYLWVSTTMQNAHDKADAELAPALENDWNSSPEDITSKIASFLLGHIREPEIIADAAAPDPGREPGRYCKVWYFAGIKRLIEGDAPGAVTFFQKSVATDQKNDCEYVFARAQLDSLGQIRQASSQLPAPGPAQ